MIVEQIGTGGDRNFGYLVADKVSGVAALIDPSYSPELLKDLASQRGLKVCAILCTHEHDDHTNGNDVAKALTGAPVIMHTKSVFPADRRVDDGDTIEVGELTVTVVYTPGHTPDAVCFYAEGSPGAVFTGDTLFVGKVGGTQGQAGARHEHSSLHERLLTDNNGGPSKPRFDTRPGHWNTFSTQKTSLGTQTAGITNNSWGHLLGPKHPDLEHSECLGSWEDRDAQGGRSAWTTWTVRHKPRAP